MLGRPSLTDGDLLGGGGTDDAQASAGDVSEADVEAVEAAAVHEEDAEGQHAVLARCQHDARVDAERQAAGTPGPRGEEAGSAERPGGGGGGVGVAFRAVGVEGRYGSEGRRMRNGRARNMWQVRQANRGWAGVVADLNRLGMKRLVR